MSIKGVIMGEVRWHVVFIYGLESEHCLAIKKLKLYIFIWSL